MKYRKLGIAWSVTWSVVAVLLIVLWAFSHGKQWQLRIRVSSENSIAVAAQAGILSVWYSPYRINGWWEYESLPATADDVRVIVANRDYPVLFVGTRYGAQVVNLPHWFSVLFAAVVSTVSWLPLRFSLRTLLISTTLVAVVLGIAVYALRK